MKISTAIKKLPKFLTHPDPSIYDSDNFIVLDFETTNLDKGTALNPDNSLVLSVWYDNRDKKFHHIVGSEYEIQELVGRCNDADFVVAHNAKFELQWLERAGLDLTKVLVFCTQVAEYVIAGNRRWTLDLDSVASRYGLPHKENVVSKMIKDGVCPSEIPSHWLLEYCTTDVRLTLNLFLEQLTKLKRTKLLNVFYSRCLSTPVLADIERNGMCLDTEFVTEEYNKVAHEYTDVMRELDEFTGGINPRSPKQVAEFLYDELQFPVPKVKGEPKRVTSQDVIAKFKPKNKRQRKFLELKKKQGKLNAALTKTLTPLYKCVEETDDNILHATFNQTRTQTHRLSSKGGKYKCQFQNFPRVYKKLFQARHKGWLIGEVDSAQLEFRAAAWLAQDKQGFEDVLNNVDAHNLTAAIIFREEYEQVQEELGMEDLSHGELSRSKLGKHIRQESKPHTFKPLYGGQSGTEREMEYYEAFRKKYKDITTMQEDWIATVLNTKKLRTVTGLIFYWPTTKMHPRTGYVTNRESICNYPVQMFATADIMPIAVRFLWQLIKILKLESFIVNTVHDSAISEVKPEEKDIYNEIAIESFNKLVVKYMEDLYDVDMNLPLEAEISFGKHWSLEDAA